MKRALIVVAAMFFTAVTTGVQAANVTFNPGSTNIVVEPGKSAVANLVVNADSNAPYLIYLRIGSVSAQGNLPASWLKPTNITLSARSGGATSSTIGLVIDVPADTPAGKYSTVVKPMILRTTEPVVSSDLMVVVEVQSQKKCPGVPVLENVQVGPKNIWAPNNKDVNIDISGTVVVASGCEVAGSYTMDSNGGSVSGNLAIDADGNFAMQIPVSVSKNAKDKNGETYNGTIAVEDAEGNKASQAFFVTVDHDRGKN